MISKLAKGIDFAGCLSYVMGKSGAQLLGGNLEGRTVQALVREFEAIRQLHPIKHPVFHCSLSLALGERLGDWDWCQVVDTYLQEMGFSKHGFVLVRHTDRPHDHVHLIANRVGFDGSVVSDSWDYHRSQRALRQIEQTYHLRSVPSSWEVQRRAQTWRPLQNKSKSGKPAARKQLQQFLDSLLKDRAAPLSLDQFVEQLQTAGIAPQLSYSNTGYPQGIRFRYAEFMFSGQQLGKKYTWTQLREQLHWENSNAIPPAAIVLGRRSQLQESIQTAIAQVATLPEFLQALQEAGITACIYGQRQQKYLVYSDGLVAFAESALARSCSLHSLQNSIQPPATESLPPASQLDDQSQLMPVTLTIYEALVARIQHLAPTQLSQRQLDLVVTGYCLQRDYPALRYLIHSPAVKAHSHTGKEDVAAYLTSLFQEAHQHLSGQYPKSAIEQSR